ncbi:EAL domain-containing protein [Desulfobacter sp.]|uniref:EAL domain-containing protein n=1 Tax=Desulfobacter sp. TaxID=2294 RepID=UPI003D0A611C
MDKENNRKPIWLESAYGPGADKMLSALGPARAQIAGAVDNFYHTLLKIPAAERILGNVSGREFDRLKKAQAGYLTMIVSPGITMDEHRRMALKIGYMHCFVGVYTDLLTESSILYGDIAGLLTSGTADEDALKRLISRRLQFDLITQIGAYVAVQHTRLDVYNQVSRLKDPETTLDLMGSVLDLLMNSFEKSLSGVAFGSVKNGTYRHMLSMGHVPFGPEHGSDTGYPTVKIRKIEQAWFNEQSFVKNHVYDCSESFDSLKEACVTKGIRSFGFFMLHDLKYAPKAYLLVCGKFPGYFSDKSMRYYWNHLADVIGGHFDMIERSRVKRQSRLSDGLTYRQLLARRRVNMYYQPIIDPGTGCTVKVEALARLVDGERIISPGLFLPSFGTSHLRDLFEIGLAQVLEKLPRVSKTPLMCSINLPPEALLDKEWLGKLPGYLVQAGADPQRICLEILESSLHDDPGVMKQLFSLREAGYSIFLDDVGAGESSLLRLVNLPVSGIKIDQSFVRSLPRSFENIDLILSLRFLTHNRGLECIAEGVENINIAETLFHMSKGQIFFQGYAYAKPMPAEDLAVWLARDNPCTPEPKSPRTLYGWYSGHIGRLFSIRNALHTIPDLIDVNRLQTAESCHLHANIRKIGGHAEIEDAHRQWHTDYARCVRRIQSEANCQDLWQTLEASKRNLQILIERAIRK